MDKNFIARKIRKLRIEQGWSQQELASRAGLAITTVNNAEAARCFSLESLDAIAVTLGCGFADLLRGGGRRKGG